MDPAPPPYAWHDAACVLEWSQICVISHIVACFVHVYLCASCAWAVAFEWKSVHYCFTVWLIASSALNLLSAVARGVYAFRLRKFCRTLNSTPVDTVWVIAQQSGTCGGKFVLFTLLFDVVWSIYGVCKLLLRLECIEDSPVMASCLVGSILAIAMLQLYMWRLRVTMYPLDTSESERDALDKLIVLQ